MNNKEIGPNFQAIASEILKNESYEEFKARTANLNEESKKREYQIWLNARETHAEFTERTKDLPFDQKVKEHNTWRESMIQVALSTPEGQKAFEGALGDYDNLKKYLSKRDEK